MMLPICKFAHVLTSRIAVLPGSAGRLPSDTDW
jgi:hypothetical protein